MISRDPCVEQNVFLSSVSLYLSAFYFFLRERKFRSENVFCQSRI